MDEQILRIRLGERLQRLNLLRRGRAFEGGNECVFGSLAQEAKIRAV